jgi:hypothetical protein
MAQYIFVKINTQRVPLGKSTQKLGYFCNVQKAIRSKQSFDGRKSAQSGHPGWQDGFGETECEQSSRNGG